MCGKLKASHLSAAMDEFWPTLLSSSLTVQPQCLTQAEVSVGQMASHLFLEHVETLRSSWSTQRLQSTQILQLQNKPKPSASTPVLHCWCKMFVVMFCLGFFAKCGAMHYGQPSCLVVCLAATLKS